ncbi:hypothetical protein TZ03_12950 [Pseudomonas sp. 10-1B]|uniref:DUF6515 family protein n=1 Tax=Pseudomonas sp. 10-1B TaxID=1546029 RepID=UPI00061FED89|nr:DUF6515 family protein [Pseudomonas sp. 10-1B]KIY40338.1 hypothetical protein TZ03_12950 [Pseudomonas sp. 10-1B]
MKSRIWQLAGVGLLGLGISLGALAQGLGEGGPGRSLNSRDEVRQTQPPRQGYYQDIPRHHGNGWGPGPQYRPGQTVERFPERYWKVPYRGQNYFYSDGYWYRPRAGGYVVVTPPYGVRVQYLPAYAREVWLGGALFFVAADTYYQYLADSREYVVVNPPVAAPAPVPVAAAGGGYDVVAYPMYGQGPQQQDQDRYQCHRWAVGQSGFDPATATYAPPANVADNYRRALGACFSGRGYSIN